MDEIIIQGLNKDDPNYSALIKSISEVKMKFKNIINFEINKKLNICIIDDPTHGPNMNIENKYTLKITRDIFKIINTDEREIFIAHEFCHIKNKDYCKRWVITVIGIFISVFI